MEILEAINEIMKPWIHDRKPNIFFDKKKLLNSIYGKQMYKFTQNEKEYIKNDINYAMRFYLFNRCCGKTWWLNSHYIDTDSVRSIQEQESKTRKMVRTHLITDTKIRIQFRRLNRKEFKVE